MNSYRPLEYQAFVLRFWREATSGTWRGQIVHLPGQETAAFADWNQALAFVGRFVTISKSSSFRDDQDALPPAGSRGEP